jgi:hypothetical protein
LKVKDVDGRGKPGHDKEVPTIQERR